MNSAVLLIGVLAAFVGGLFFYGRFLESLLGIDPSRRTPAHEKNDGVDFVPARHWLTLFGHHFSSICGAGPIVGPALAVAYWGWAPSLVWILLGALFLGAVSDFTSLVISVRHDGRSITDVAGTVISPRARLLFAVFIWIALLLVIAVFSILAAKTFVSEPGIVIPSIGLIPVAAGCGWFLYARKSGLAPVTLAGLALLAIGLWAGPSLPVRLPETMAGLSAEQAWILVLLIYCFVASVTPVQYLLQPRDYLASYLLFAAIAAGVLGTLISHPPMQAAAVAGWNPSEWPAAGPLWPMMLVTIACGAISGFHALVSSGTTCKQLGSEAHACRIGYGGMLLEGLVGALVVVCVGAGLSVAQHSELIRGPGAVAAFGAGFGELVRPLMGGFGKIFAIVALNAFILTTLDTATRITRYLTAELFGLKGRYLPTLLAVVLAGAMALSGHWRLLWPAFGTSNQLIAALSLLVISAWLLSRGRPVLYTAVPALLMLATTLAAFIWQLHDALVRTNYKLSVILLLLITLSLVMVWETARRWKTTVRSSAG